MDFQKNMQSLTGLTGEVEPNGELPIFHRRVMLAFEADELGGVEMEDNIAVVAKLSMMLSRA